MTVRPSALIKRGWGRCSAAPLLGESEEWSENERLNGREGSRGRETNENTCLRERKIIYETLTWNCKRFRPQEVNKRKHWPARGRNAIRSLTLPRSHVVDFIARSKHASHTLYSKAFSGWHNKDCNKDWNCKCFRPQEVLKKWIKENTGQQNGGMPYVLTLPRSHAVDFRGRSKHASYTLYSKAFSSWHNKDGWPTCVKPLRKIAQINTEM